MKYRVEQSGKQLELDVEVVDGGYVVRGPDGAAHSIRLERRADGTQRAITPWGELSLHSANRGGEIWVQAAGRRLNARVERTRRSAIGAASTAGASALRAPMAGKLLRIEVQPGDQVRVGQALVVIEAMKMENELSAPFAGTVIEVLVSAPSAVDKGALLLRLEPV
jgi:acetyl-CoA/propionyl-CoA carboxylase, biotin carboxylase, biotin carboxyl carrier protein